MVVKAVQYLNKNRHPGQQNRTENPEIDPHINKSQLTFNKSVSEDNPVRQRTNTVKATGYHMQKNEVKSLSHSSVLV